MSTENSPTARALMTLELIQNTPGVTAEQLAGALGVTERAARRYVGMLREAEIPILSTRGRYGGYRVGRGVRLPPLIFSSAEALGLVMAALDAALDPSDADDPVGSALGKIVRALPEPVARQAEAVRRSTYTVPNRRSARPDPAVTATLVEASSRHRVVELGYRSEAGAEWVARVEPWAVVARHGRWYLLCRLLRSGELRTYRLDRVQSLELTADEFLPPDDLDPVTTLEENFALGWEYHCEVLIDAPADSLAWFPRSIGQIEHVDATTSRLSGTTSDPEYYLESLVLLHVPWRVVGGPELRAAVRELGRQLLAAAGTEEAPGSAQ
ncbi:MAG: WYL domain-containing protein [Propionicimonas sp.]|nr:WYL domain-containing protein [Propionicimonas sp.]